MGMSAGPQQRHYTLLTGATGLVGSMLLRDLLSRGNRVAVLVRPSRKQSSAERIESIVRYWQRQQARPLPRPVCLVGDVAEPNVGLDRRDEQWLARHCDRVIHCAAVVKFSSCGEASDVWKTNFGGTRQMLQLCRRIGVRDFHYVSTAYVCGRRQGVIRESELAMGQSFRNDYERSKYEAESLLRADGFLDPATIYRPAVIGGDSQTGYTNSYHGIYVYLRLLHSLLTNTAPDRQGRRFAPLRILLDGTERRNVVPLDWVCSVVCRLLDEPAARGLTFHLAPPTPLTTGEFFDAAYRYFNAYGYEFCGKNGKLTGKVTSYEEAFLAYRTPYEQYELTDPVFDRSNLNRLAADLVCPQIDAEVIRRYVRFAELAAWGKRPLDASLPNTAAPQQRAA